MGEIKIHVEGETCPVPLVEMRKAVRKAAPGDIIEIYGTHPMSKKEIPIAVKTLGLKILETSEEGNVWKIRILK